MTTLPATPAGVPAIAAENVGPGLGGFLAIFVLALVTVLLIRSMVGHLRKVRYGPGPDGDAPAADAPQGPPAGARATDAAGPAREVPEDR